MKDITQTIKRDLEMFYDVPFEVKLQMNYNDPIYYISPQNDFGELFEIKIHFRQRIRMIVEVEPQKFAASMIEEINNSDNNKRNLFLTYIGQIKKRCSKFEVFVNQRMVDISISEIWDEKWNDFRIRATQIIEESTDEKETEIILEWARLFVGLVMSLLEIEKIGEHGFAEGKVTQVLQNKYERNPVNRELCLSINGYRCKICDFDFEKFYGKLGYHFIHVHHIEMVSSHGGEYYLNPAKDMIPVCPNCHAMLHRANPPLKPGQLQEIIEIQKEQENDYE